MLRQSLRARMMKVMIRFQAEDGGLIISGSSDRSKIATVSHARGHMHSIPFEWGWAAAYSAAVDGGDVVVADLPRQAVRVKT